MNILKIIKSLTGIFTISVVKIQLETREINSDPLIFKIIFIMFDAIKR